MTQQPDYTRVIVTLPTILAAVFSILYLGKESIWLDEAYSIAFAHLEWKALWSLVSSLEINMSIYYFLLKLWIGIFNDSEFAARSLSAILAVPAVALTCAIGRRLFNIEIGSIAGVLLATNAFFINYAQETRGYSLLLSISTLSMYVFLVAMERSERKYFVALGFVNAVVLYVHLFGAFILLAQAISFVIAPKEAVQWRRIIASFMIAALIASPLGIALLATDLDPLTWMSKPSFVNILSAVKALTGKGLLVVTILYFLCGLSFLVFAVRKRLAGTNRQLQWRYSLLLLWLILPIACPYLISLVTPAFNNRYLITALPALVIIVAVGISNLRSKSFQHIIIALLILTSVYNLFDQYFSLAKRDWRMAANVVLTNSQPGDAILFYSWVAKYPFEYYYRKTQGSDGLGDRLICVWPSPFLKPAQRENLDAYTEFATQYRDPNKESLESLSRYHNRLWVVLAMDNIAGSGWKSGPIIDAIEEKFIRDEVFSLERITILRYSKMKKD